MTNFTKSMALKVSFMEHAYNNIRDEVFPQDEARAIVNEFLLDHLKDGFCAGGPTLVMFPITPVWIVPILFSYPQKVLGTVGDIVIDALTGDILGWTPFSEVNKNAEQLVQD
jgi:hypothetical protein